MDRVVLFGGVVNHKEFPNKLPCFAERWICENYNNNNTKEKNFSDFQPSERFEVYLVYKIQSEATILFVRSR